MGWGGVAKGQGDRHRRDLEREGRRKRELWRVAERLGKGRRGGSRERDWKREKTLNSGGGGEIPGIEMKTKEQSCC